VLWIAADFTPEEFQCRCSACKGRPIPDHLEPRVLSLVGELQKARDVLQAPLIITSGVRCEAHNQAVGGGAYSQHRYGRAVDLKSPGLTGAWLAGFFDCLIRQGLIMQGGLGVYKDKPNMFHYDNRGTKARWVK
jgi:zinc D-Ala-D-Ala carboxypeptidase